MSPRWLFVTQRSEFRVLLSISIILREEGPFVNGVVDFPERLDERRTYKRKVLHVDPRCGIPCEEGEERARGEGQGEQIDRGRREGFGGWF